MKLTLEKTIKEAKDTGSFVWKAKKSISWLPGQYMYFTLPKLDHPDKRGGTRMFTVSSSPTEGKIMFTTRLRKESGLKKTLDKLKIGTIIEAEGPSGTYILDEKEKGPHVLIAGGIGITPFRSIIKYHTDKKTDINIHLIYSNQTAESTAFKKDLERWAKENNKFKIDFIMTKSMGRINEKMLKEMVDLTSQPTFWLCGPPDMVTSMETVIGKLGITADKVRSEKFTGY